MVQDLDIDLLAAVTGGKTAEYAPHYPLSPYGREIWPKLSRGGKESFDIMCNGFPPDQERACGSQVLKTEPAD